MYERRIIIIIYAWILFTLVWLSVIACDINDTSTCGSIWVSCPAFADDVSVCDNCTLIDTAVNDTTIYFRFRDCETDKIFQSSVGSDCTIEVR